MLRTTAGLATFFAISALLSAKDRWTELNIGPFYVTTAGDEAAARRTLTELEQVRWVLGGLLESKDLPSLWPIRVMLTNDNGPAYAPQFVRQNAQYIWVGRAKDVPLGNVAGLLLDANTPRLPPGVESGLRALFSTLEAHGSRVTWGASPAHPDLDWARMQLFATKFEYGASFHIFLTALKGGSTLQAAEHNAFGKPVSELEAEAEANLKAGNWKAVPVSGRPLDPKRDFGLHPLDDASARVYLAAADPAGAEAAYKSAIEADGPARALGYEGLAQAAEAAHENPKEYWDAAMRTGSRSAPVYVGAADGLPAAQALPLLKRAAALNPAWAEPIYQQAQIATEPAEKEALLKQALALEPRATARWIELAKLQTEQGKATAAQGSWLRAEDSAPTDAERERVHQQRMDAEGERLNAAEEERRHERDSARLADERAQQAEAARIHAAEQKANQALGSEQDKPSDVVPWNTLAKKKKLVGTLVRVDCLPQAQRLSVRDRAGNVTVLLLQQIGGGSRQLTCGYQTRPHRISVEYTDAPDPDGKTAGEILSLQLQ